MPARALAHSGGKARVLRKIAFAVATTCCACTGAPPAPGTTLELNIDRTARRGGYSAVSFKVERAILFYGHAPAMTGDDCGLRGGLEAPFSTSEVQFDLLSTGMVRVGEMSVLPGQVAELRLLVSAPRIELNGRWVEAEVKERCRDGSARQERGVLRMIVPANETVSIAIGELKRLKIPFDPTRDIVAKRGGTSSSGERRPPQSREKDDEDGDDDLESEAGVEDGGRVRGAFSDKVLLCHVPEENPSASHVLRVGRAAVPEHLAHGDYLGVCKTGPDAGAPTFDAGRPAVPDAGAIFDPCLDGGTPEPARLILASRYALLPVASEAFTLQLPALQLGTHDCRYDVLEAHDDPTSQLSGDAERTYAPPLRFAVPEQLRVVQGNSGNHLATLTWWLGESRTDCVYRGA